jgi:polar amino acid transport system substrate-binding protein
MTGMNYTRLLSLIAAAAMVSQGSAAENQATKIPNFVGEAGLSSRNSGTPIRALRFLTTLDFPPFSYLDESDKLTGFNVYLAKSICSELQIEASCTIQAVPFDELMSTVEAGRADAIISGLASTSEHREQFNFSNSYLRFPGRFVSLKSVSTSNNFDSGLADVKIGVIAGSGHEKLARAFFPQASVTGYANDTLLSDELIAKKIDLMFGDGMSLSFWINGEASKNCCTFFGGAYYSSHYLGEGMRIAALNSRPDVIQAIDRSLAVIQQKGGLDELFLRFFPNSFY